MQTSCGPADAAATHCACVRACVCVHVRCVEIDRLIISQAVVSRVAVSVPRWGRGRITPPPANRGYAPKFSRTLDRLWSIDSQKISKFGATRCQILRLK